MPIVDRSFSWLMKLVIAMSWSAGTSIAQERESSKAPPRIERELIYGSELMTDQELDRYRTEVSKLKTDEERRSYRERHRVRLRERAHGRGVELQEPAGVVQRRDSR